MDLSVLPAGESAPVDTTSPEVAPRSPYDRLEAALTTLVRAAHRVPLRVEGAPPLERAGYGLLARLHDYGPMRLSGLATCFGLDPSTVSRQVQGLEEAALVVRRPDPEDRRAGFVELTAAGREALLLTRAARRETMRALLEGWTESECDQLASSLERLTDRLQQLKVGHHATGRSPSNPDSSA
jgi:DNA-binding MarR family transcriptional regulator